MKTTNLIIGQRKDTQGRNTVLSLQYYTGFASLGKYDTLNIHQKIMLRTSFCGCECPNIMIAEQIKFEQNNLML